MRLYCSHPSRAPPPLRRRGRRIRGTRADPPEPTHLLNTIFTLLLDSTRFHSNPLESTRIHSNPLTGRQGGGGMGRGGGKEISSDFEQAGRLSKQWPCHGKVSRPTCSKSLFPSCPPLFPPPPPRPPTPNCPPPPPP